MFGNNCEKKLIADNWLLKRENDALKSRLAAESIIASFDLLDSIRTINPNGETELRISVNNDHEFTVGIHMAKGRIGTHTYTDKKFDSFHISGIDKKDAQCIQSRLVREMTKQFHKYIRGE